MHTVRTGARLATGSPLPYATYGILFKSMHSSLVLDSVDKYIVGDQEGRLIRQREQFEQRQESGDLVVSGQGEKRYKVVCQAHRKCKLHIYTTK